MQFNNVLVSELSQRRNFLFNQLVIALRPLLKVEHFDCNILFDEIVVGKVNRAESTFAQFRLFLNKLVPDRMVEVLSK